MCCFWSTATYPSVSCTALCIIRGVGSTVGVHGLGVRSEKKAETTYRDNKLDSNRLLGERREGTRVGEAGGLSRSCVVFIVG